MLLYITAEDVFGSETPKRRGPRPLHTLPATVAGLFDLGLRHHIRTAALASWAAGHLDWMPDWKFDRLAIRLALFGRERLGLQPGERALVLGRLGWLWPMLDFACMGFGVVPVGIEHDASDDSIADVAAFAAPRAAYATDAESAERLMRLRRARRLGDATVVAEGLADEEGLLPLARLTELAGVLDTAERAQAFRAFSRRIASEAPALWHAGPRGLVRLSHQAAMAEIIPALRAHPAREGEVAYLDAPRVTLRKRLALAAFVGDGYTTTALGREGRAPEDLERLQPHAAVVSEPWLGAACEGRGPRWPGGLDRAWARRRVLQALGGRLTRIEVGLPLSTACARALAAAGVALDVRDGGPSNRFQ